VHSNGVGTFPRFVCYRKAADVIAQTAAQSHNVDTNATISKSPLVSGAASRSPEDAGRDGRSQKLR
jgi:hypothetical protein